MKHAFDFRDYEGAKVQISEYYLSARENLSKRLEENRTENLELKQYRGWFVSVAYQFSPERSVIHAFPSRCLSPFLYALHCLIRSDKLVRVPSIPAKVYLAELEINSKHGPTFRWNVSTSKFVDAITTRWKRIPTRWTWKSCSTCIRSGKRVDSFQSDRWLAAVFLVALDRPPSHWFTVPRYDPIDWPIKLIIIALSTRNATTCAMLSAESLDRISAYR